MGKVDLEFTFHMRPVPRSVVNTGLKRRQALLRKVKDMLNAHCFRKLASSLMAVKQVLRYVSQVPFVVDGKMHE